jgi:tRNA U54 and U55 pseudouridine synthase Pus10
MSTIPLEWTEKIVCQPVYLLGRYRKLARDVPQAPWSVFQSGGDDDREDEKRARCDTEEEGGNAGGDNDSCDDGNVVHDNEYHGGQDAQIDNPSFSLDASKLPDSIIAVSKSRKGRNSVEEIVSESVCKFLDAKYCRMHPCGREDIDVR